MHWPPESSYIDAADIKTALNIMINLWAFKIPNGWLKPEEKARKRSKEVRRKHKKKRRVKRDKWWEKIRGRGLPMTSLDLIPD